MANIKSAKKRIKTTLKNTLRNAAQKSQMRTAIRKVEGAIKLNAKEDAAGLFQNAMSKIAKTAQKGIIHKNTAARKISSLSAKIKALGQ
ncbi:30S ribosomal protein S20 [Rickettsiales bacterium LUAb2]